MQVPVDVILILTSNYDDGNQCYIETANIDGETNYYCKVHAKKVDEKILPYKHMDKMKIMI